MVPGNTTQGQQRAAAVSSMAGTGTALCAQLYCFRQPGKQAQRAAEADMAGKVVHWPGCARSTAARAHRGGPVPHFSLCADPLSSPTAGWAPGLGAGKSSPARLTVSTHPGCCRVFPLQSRSKSSRPAALKLLEAAQMSAHSQLSPRQVLHEASSALNYCISPDTTVPFLTAVIPSVCALLQPSLAKFREDLFLFVKHTAKPVGWRRLKVRQRISQPWEIHCSKARWKQQTLRCLSGALHILVL